MINAIKSRLNDANFMRKFFAVMIVLLVLGMFFGPDGALAKGSDREYTDWNSVVDHMEEVAEGGKKSMEAGDYDAAYDAVNECYYGIYETTGFERNTMGYISGSRKSEVELQFSAAKATAKNHGTVEEYETEVDELISMVREDANKLDGTSDDGGGLAGDAATFVACLSIIVREGIEAILVLAAIIAYLVKSGMSKNLRQVYLGAILGVVCSFIAAGLLYALNAANAAPQEIIEGVTALVACAMLFWVSNWMLSKSESAAWSQYINKKVTTAATTGSTFALAFTAWLSVFREGAEVVLFYQPLLADGNPFAIWGGFAVGCIIIAIVFIAVRFYSVKLPLKPFFTAMSILMFIMCISFLGSGIKELIEGDVIVMTPIPWIPSNQVLEVLGIYPCVETVVPQIILLVVVLVGSLIITRRNRRLAREAAANASEIATAEETPKDTDTKKEKK